MTEDCHLLSITHFLLCFSLGLRSVQMSHAYDFYKPNLDSEYPVVDGKLSIECFLKAVEKTYHGYLKKAKQKQKTTEYKGHVSSLDDID